MTSLVVFPQETPLKGAVAVPGDKSISHRAVILAAIAEGSSRIRNWLPAGDTLATLEAIRDLGVAIEIEEDGASAWLLHVKGRGLYGLQPPPSPLHCRNAGTCMRLLAGILAGQSFSSILDGSDQLRKRPMDRIVNPLRQMGADIETVAGRAPLTIRPSSLHGIEYALPMASAQVKSAVLLAGLYAHGDTTVIEPGPSRDHTERMLQAMGVPLGREGDEIVLRRTPVSSPIEPTLAGQSYPGELALQPLHLTVPNDMSSAAFPLAAAAIVPDSRVTLLGTGSNETRTGFLDLLARMGASLDVENPTSSGGETIADIALQQRPLYGIEVSGHLVVRAIDELPVWAVVGSQANGLSELSDAAELRLKEVDRISVLAGELGKMGANVNERSDGLAIIGPTRLRAAEVDSHGDHRLGMALAIAGLVTDGPTSVQNAECIADSFPGFVETMQSLGATMRWVA